MTARDFGWPRSAYRKGVSLVADRRRSRRGRCEAHQAQLLLAAGNPDTEAAPVWRRVSLET